MQNEELFIQVRQGKSQEMQFPNELLNVPKGHKLKQLPLEIYKPLMHATQIKFIVHRRQPLGQLLHVFPY